MAIAYPRALPCGVQSVTMEPAYAQAVNRTRAGSAQALELADPRWRAEITYAPRAREAHAELRAWLMSAEGALVRALVHDALQPYPLAYPRAALQALTRPGGGAFDGTATVTALGPASLSLGSLPAGFLLRPGDYVGLVQAGRYGLVRVLEAATASGAGAVALDVRPRGQTKFFTTAAVAQLVRPACLMTLDPSSIGAARSAGQRSPISFSGIQHLA